MNPFSLLIAGLVGSAHCAVMCGGFAVGISAGEHPHRRLMAWHGGRGVAYVALGALAGWLGARLDGLVETLVGLQSVVGPMVGVTLIFMAVHELGWLPKRTPKVQIREPASRRRVSVFARLLRWARRDGLLPPAVLGLGTALLPCGWLWAALAVAAATQSALAGALSMGAFWLGSVPLLTAIGGASGLLFGRVRRWARPALVVALLIGGVLSLTGHLLATPKAESPTPPVCHG